MRNNCNLRNYIKNNVKKSQSLIILHIFNGSCTYLKYQYLWNILRGRRMVLNTPDRVVCSYTKFCRGIIGTVGWFSWVRAGTAIRHTMRIAIPLLFRSGTYTDRMKAAELRSIRLICAARSDAADT